MDKNDLALEFAKIELEYANHHETQRERMTSLILAMTAICAAASGWDNKIDSADSWLGVFLMMIGVFGSIFSLKHYERWMLHYARYRKYRESLDQEIEGSSILKLKSEADKSHNDDKNKMISAGIGLNIPWAALPFISLVLGFGITLFAFLNSWSGE